MENALQKSLFESVWFHDWYRPSVPLFFVPLCAHRWQAVLQLLLEIAEGGIALVAPFEWQQRLKREGEVDWLCMCMAHVGLLRHVLPLLIVLLHGWHRVGTMLLMQHMCTQDTSNSATDD